MDSFRPEATNQAFTLVELLVVLAVLALVLLLTMPSFRDMLHGTRLRVEAGRLLSSLNLARSEAVHKGLPVSVCPAASSAAPACGTRYRDGYLVFRDPGRDGLFELDAGDELLQRLASLPRDYRVLDRAGMLEPALALTYLPDGSSRSPSTLLFCAPPGMQVRGWSVILSRVGRVRLSRNWGQCPDA